MPQAILSFTRPNTAAIDAPADAGLPTPTLEVVPKANETEAKQAPKVKAKRERSTAKREPKVEAASKAKAKPKANAPETAAPKGTAVPKDKGAPQTAAPEAEAVPPSSRATDKAIEVIRAAAEKGETITEEMIQTAAGSPIFSKDPELRKLDMRDWNAFNRGLTPRENILRHQQRFLPK